MIHLLETIPPISPGEFNPTAPFPGNVCSEPGLLPGAPPVELPSFFPGPILEPQSPTQVPGISVERPEVLGDGVYRISKADSPIWQSLEPYKGSIRKLGSGRKTLYFEWDYTHNDIEVYVFLAK